MFLTQQLLDKQTKTLHKYVSILYTTQNIDQIEINRSEVSRKAYLLKLAIKSKKGEETYIVDITVTASIIMFYRMR